MSDPYEHFLEIPDEKPNCLINSLIAVKIKRFTGVQALYDFIEWLVIDAYLLEELVLELYDGALLGSEFNRNDIKLSINKRLKCMHGRRDNKCQFFVLDKK